MSKFFIENYGCQMNVSEASSLRAFLSESGHIEAAESAAADVAIINTCSVRGTAEQRVRGRIGYYKGLNETNGTNIRVIIMGCMAQHYGPKLKKEYPDTVEAVWGTYHKEGVLKFLDDLRWNDKGDSMDLENYTFLQAQPQEKFPFKSFVPISHGCDNFCSYCIVPHVRGREVGRSGADIIRNIEALAKKGVKEIILIGQNVNSYRADDGLTFPALLDRIAKTTGIPRLGFMTSHPKDLSPDLIEVIRANDNVMKNIHLPLQAGSDRILELMNRKYTAVQFLEKVAMAESIPGISLTTDIIVGFPGETEEEFLQTMSLLEKVRFHEAYTYYYNKRTGTHAAEMKDEVPLAEKKRRLAYLIERQSVISTERMKEGVGMETTVLVDNVSRKRSHEISGRAHNYLMTFMEGTTDLVGKIVKVRVTGSGKSSLKGKIV